MNFKVIVLSLMALAFCFFAYIFIDRKEYGYATITIVVALAFMYLVFVLNKPRQPIPKHIVIQKFIELMEEKYHISINTDNQTIFRDEETPTEYVIVLKDVDEGTGHNRFFPFECNKFELMYGRGTGSIKWRMGEVHNWLLQNNRLNLRADVYQELHDYEMGGQKRKAGGDTVDEGQEE